MGTGSALMIITMAW